MRDIVDSLKVIMEKEPIVNTFESHNLFEDPSGVRRVCEANDATHIDIGESEKVFKTLVKRVVGSSNAAVGVVVGDYGYGKTSLLVHMFVRCRDHKILAVPPFMWRSTGELARGIYGWCRYIFEQKTALRKRVDAIYDQLVRESGLEVLAETINANVEKMKSKLSEQKLALLTNISPKQVIDFLEKLTEVALEDGYSGLVVFTDELQRTLASYGNLVTFFDDMYGFANELFNRKGAYGMVFGIPLGEWSLMLDMRKDVAQRLQSRQIFVDCGELYGRTFAPELWNRYSEVFEFPGFEVVEKETLDSISQICFRKDLGSGPRGVIDAFKRIAEHYTKMRRPYTPIDLIDDILDNQLTTAKDSQLVAVVGDVLELDVVKNDPNLAKLFKLLSAFPKYGCKTDLFEKYGLVETFESMRIKYHGTRIVDLEEGYTLSAFATEDTYTKKVYDSILKSYVQTYARTPGQVSDAIAAFAEHVLSDVFNPAQGSQIFDAWRKLDSEELSSGGYRIDFVGSFGQEYPERLIQVTVSTRPEDFDQLLPRGVSVDIFLNLNSDDQSPGKINVIGSQVLVELNACRSVKENLPIQILTTLPEKYRDATFLLSVISFLDENIEQLPQNEVQQVSYFISTLKDIATATLFNENMIIEKAYKVKNFGNSALKEILLQVWKNLYPKYKTMIVNAQWDTIISYYCSLAKDENVPYSSKRGGRSFSIPRKELESIIGTKRSTQSLRNRLDIMKKNLELLRYDKVEEETDPIVLELERHALENLILDLVEDSSTRRIKGYDVQFVSIERIIELCSIQGYTDREVHEAINILCARGMIKRSDSEIERTIESIDERTNGLLTRLSRYESNMTKASTIIDSAAASKIPPVPVQTSIEGISTSTELDPVEDQIAQAETALKIALVGTSKERITQLGNISNKLSEYSKASIDKVLVDRIEGTVGWTGELESCRSVLNTQHGKLTKAITDVVKKTGKWIESLEKADTIEEMIDSLTACELESLNEIEIRMKEFDLHVKELRAWLSMLDIADNVYSKTIEIENVHDESELNDQMQNLGKEINDLLAKMKIAALADYEIYSKKIEKIQKKVDKQESERRKVFLDRKANIEKILAAAGVAQQILPSHYDPIQPRESFESMEEVARQKLIQFITELEGDAKSAHTSLTFAEKALEKDASEVLLKIDEIMGLISKTKLNAARIGFASEEELKSLSAILKEINKGLNEIRPSLTILVEPGKATQIEKAILDKIKTGEPCDIQTLIISEIETSDEFKLESFMSVILSLFKKNLINFRIVRRR